MLFELTSFNNLFWRGQCPNCAFNVCIDLNNKDILKYGFVCNVCKTITNAEEMFNIIVIFNKKSN